MTTADDNKKETQLRQSGLRFVGAITASVTHELNNILGIVDQNAGLLDDLLNAAEEGTPLSAERVDKVADKLAHHAARGAQIIKRLNAFAHSVDHDRQLIDLGEVADHMVALMTRFATLKKVSLKTEGASVTIDSSPFHVRQLLYVLIKRALEVSASGDTIVVETASWQQGGKLTVAGPVLESDSSEDKCLLELLLETVSGVCTQEHVEGGTTTEVVFPARGPEVAPDVSGQKD